MDDRLKTLEDAIMAMQEKIRQQIPVFKAAPLAQEVTVGTGEEILRQNPIVSEFRALVKDYSQAVKAYKELVADSKSSEDQVSNLNSLRNKIKVAK